MKAEDLVGSLQTFGLKFDNSKKKSIALNSSVSKSKISKESTSECEDEEDLAALWLKTSLIILRAREDQKITNKRNNLINIEVKLNLAPLKTSQRTSSAATIKITLECPTKVKLKRKGLVANATWDDSLESELESNESHHGKNEIYPILMASTNPTLQWQ